MDDPWKDGVNPYTRREVKQPCVKDCPDRKGGCAVTCEKWAAYVKERDKRYAEQAEAAALNMTPENHRKARNRAIARKKKYPGRF